MTLQERLRSAGADGDAIYCWNLCVEAAAELDRLQARVAELEADAERYRWLRDTAKGIPDSAEFWPVVRLDLPRAQDDAWCFNADMGLDAAIDTARKAKP